MKKIVTIILVAVLLLSLTIFGLVACNTDKDLYYVSMRINPEVEMIVNGRGKVEAVNAVNEDGAIVLEGVDIIGKNVEDASVLFAEKAAELGFMDVSAEENIVYVGVEGENEKASLNFNKDITEKLNGFFSKNGIYGKVSQETLDKYAAEAQEWGVNFGQAKMIIRVLEMYPEMTAEQVLDMTVQERMKLLKENKNNMTPAIREEYKQKVAVLKEEYASMFALGEEIVALKAKIDSEELTEEQKEQINSQIAEKQAEFDAMHAEYKAKLDEIKAECKQKCEQAKQTHKAQCEERKSQHGKKFAEHKNRCRKDKNLQKNIKAWQNR